MFIYAKLIQDGNNHSDKFPAHPQMTVLNIRVFHD